MDDKTKKRSGFVDKFTRKQYAPLPEKPQLVRKEQEPYEAITETRGNKRTTLFKVIMQDGISYGCSYAQLLNWIYMPPDGLQIITSTYNFDIEGTGLDKLDAALLDDRVRILRVFNPQIHSKPEKGEAVIESIVIQQQEL